MLRAGVRANTTLGRSRARRSGAARSQRRAASLGRQIAAQLLGGIPGSGRRARARRCVRVRAKRGRLRGQLCAGGLRLLPARAGMDLADLAGNVSDGIHIASCEGRNDHRPDDLQAARRLGAQRRQQRRDTSSRAHQRRLAARHLPAQHVQLTPAKVAWRFDQPHPLWERVHNMSTLTPTRAAAPIPLSRARRIAPSVVPDCQKPEP
jgi:hypothetical protein